jgi:hypothetical protein
VPVASFSARRLDKLLADIAARPTIGLDLLREIGSQLRAVAEEMDLPAKKVVARTLVSTLQSICDKYDGEPMTAEESATVAELVGGPVQDALRFLNADDLNPNDAAIALMARLIK